MVINFNIWRPLLCLFLLTQVLPCGAQKTNPSDQPEELGLISWHRSYEDAIKEAEKLGKPILLLFQEVPGCATCRRYGSQVLSDPRLCEIVQNEFIPLVIYNNKGGDDARILKQFNEPSWNNPVVRFIDAQGKDIVSRLSGNYTKKILAHNIDIVLYLSGDSGEYADIWLSEMLSDDRTTEERRYAMYCFWSGEAALGQLEGVVRTEPGFDKNGEVVKVWYNKSELSAKKLDKYADEKGFKHVSNAESFRPDRDPQYHITKSRYRFIPMTAQQRSRINSALADQRDPSFYLSPSQSVYLKDHVSGNNSGTLPVLYREDFDKAWEIMMDKI